MVLLHNPTWSLNHHSISSIIHIKHSSSMHPLHILDFITFKSTKLFHTFNLSNKSYPTTSQNLNMTHKNSHLFNFGTKSTYPVPYPIHYLPNLNQQDHFAPRLIHVSLIARHGSRNPTNNCIKRMTCLENWLCQVFPTQPQWLKDWSQVLQNYRRNPGCLTIEGEQELSGIGYRFAQLYAKHLDHVGGIVRVRASYKDRAVASARSFLSGYTDACESQNLGTRITTAADGETTSDLSETDSTELDHTDSDVSEPSETESSESDSIDSDSIPRLGNIHECSSVSSSDDDSPLVEVLPNGEDAILRYFERNTDYATFASEHKASTRRDLARGALRTRAFASASRISTALGVSTKMDVDLLRALAEACAFDHAHGRSNASRLCQILSPEDTAVLEAFEKRHRPFFEGHKRFRTVAAPLVADLLYSLESSVGRREGVPTNAADLRFAHAETLVPLLLLLGIRSNGLNPKSDEFRAGLSGMSPFAANLALELYEERCGNSIQHFVRFRLHERYVEKIPALGKHGATGKVKLNHLLSFFRAVLDEKKPQYQ